MISDPSKRNVWLAAACASALFLFGSWYYLFAPPVDFPAGSIVSVAQGASVPEIAQQFANMHIIAHPQLLRFVLRISGTGTEVQSGAYRFAAPQNLFVVAYRLVTGSYDLPPVRITFIEGVTVREMAEQVEAAFPSITAAEFRRQAKPYEGYLFPDTYLFSPAADGSSIIATMRANFDAKIASSSRTIAASGHSLSDIVIIASLIEKEARTSANKHLVAGVLWNRLKIGMPLQVDAVFGYIFNRDTYSPSFADLKVDSPYNTYMHTGLPPGPIDNPGLDSLEAAINPTKTNYLYYLTGKDNVMHYATTYAEHLVNQSRYLR